MKLLIRTIQEPHREHDVTHRLVTAIAEELWRLYGGNEQLNWIEAELHLQRIVGQARADARETHVLFMDQPVAAAAPSVAAKRGLGKHDRKSRPASDRLAQESARSARRDNRLGGPRRAPERFSREKAALLR